MNSSRRPRIIRNHYVLGIYQILGGLLGVVIVLSFLFTPFESQGFALAVVAVALAFFGFSIFCGIACIKKEKYAYKLSRINQCLQLVAVYGQNIGFVYVSLIGVFLGINLEYGFWFTAESHLTVFSFSFSEDSHSKRILINLVALYFLFNFNVLIREQKESELPGLEP